MTALVTLAVEAILAESGEAIASYQLVSKFADRDPEQVSVGEEQAHTGSEWAAPGQHFQLPIDGRRQQEHSVVLKSHAVPAEDSLEGSLLDALMTQFTEVDFTVGPSE